LPVKRQYMLARLREQLDNATSGGTVNIFRVKRRGGEEDEVVNGASGAGLGLGMGAVGEEDAEGELDLSVVQGTPAGGGQVASNGTNGAVQAQRRSSILPANAGQRAQSVASNR
jgi:hypothetical protein